MDLPGHFIAKGKIQLEPGWKLLEGIDAKEVLLPEVNKGDMVSLVKAEVNEVERKPPKPHTEKTLLRVMETCGIFKMRIVHSQLFCLFIHQIHKGFFGPCRLSCSRKTALRSGRK